MKMKKLISLLLLLVLFSGCVKTAPCTAHVDADENLRCDLCDSSVLITFDLYAINDLHGKLDDGDTHPGVDELTTYLRTMQAKDEISVLLSVGDMWQGSAESNMTQGLIITDWMNEMDFACMTLGNHEYDWGEAVVELNRDAAEFPFLAINIYDLETDELVDYCEASVVVDCGTIQIGIIGAIGDCYSSIASDKTEDIYFKTGEELTALVKAESQRLREEGVDFIVYSLHDGHGTSGTSYMSDSILESYYDISLSDGYVDLVFEAHTHQKYLAQDQYGVYHIQHKGDNTGGISHVEIAYNPLTDTYTVLDAALISIDTYKNLADDPIVDSLLQKYEAEISASKELLGYNAAYRNSAFLAQKVADLYFEAGLAKWGDAYDIVLGGGFMSVRSPYNLEKGDVTYGDLQTLLPFDNELVLCSISGSDLLKRFINTDNDRYYICMKDIMIDPNETYYIVVDSYTSTYAPNHLTEIERYGEARFARDLLAEFVAQGGLS